MLWNLRSIYIKEFTAEVDDAKVTNFRINAKVTFALKDTSARGRQLLLSHPTVSVSNQTCPGNRCLLYFIDVNSGVVASSEGK